MAVHALIAVLIVLCCCSLSISQDSSNGLAGAPALPRLLHANLLSENPAQNASADDSLLKQVTWSNVKQREPAAPKFVRNRVIDYSLKPRSKLQKRASNALIQFPQCLSCSKRAQTQGAVSMDMFSAAQLIDKMNMFATIGSCLFYGQRKKGSNPRSLSNSAQTYVCAHVFQYRCIWDLWPADPDSCKIDENYYCLNPYRDPADPSYPCCWLSPLMDGATTEDERVDKAMLYFQQMSQAMALTCTGDVYILSEDASTINTQIPGERPSIWLSHELPTLQELKRKGKIDKLIALTGTINAWTGSVDVSHYLNENLNSRGMPEPTEFTKEVARAIMKKRKQLMDSGFSLNNATDTLHRLGKRACGTASSFESPNGDYFG